MQGGRKVQNVFIVVTFYDEHWFFLKVQNHSFKCQYNLKEGVSVTSQCLEELWGLGEQILRHQHAGHPCQEGAGGAEIAAEEPDEGGAGGGHLPGEESMQGLVVQFYRGQCCRRWKMC